MSGRYATNVAITALNDRAGAVHAWKPRQIHRATVDGNAGTSGIVYCVSLGVFGPFVLGRPRVTRVEVVVGAARKTITTDCANFLVRADDHAADACAPILAPGSNMFGQAEESEVPIGH
jgi:hypothetical protein